jgi:hypothetical protein
MAKLSDEDLRAAYRRMEDGRRVIDCQRVLIATRKALGESTAQLEELLATFENSQAELESDLVRIRGTMNLDQQPRARGNEKTPHEAGPVNG